MSTEDAVLLARRTVATLLTAWALTEVSYLPRELYSFLRYSGDSVAVTASSQYWHRYYLLTLSFNAVRVIGFFLAARWLYRGGPEVAELLLPSTEKNEQT